MQVRSNNNKKKSISTTVLSAGSALGVLLHFLLNRLFKIVDNFGLSLYLLLVLQDRQRLFLLHAVDLSFLPQPHCRDSGIPGSTHHIARLFELLDLLTGQPDLSSPRNTLATFNVLRIGLSLSRQKTLPKICLFAETVDVDRLRPDQ